MINFTRCRLFANVIRELQNYQNGKYLFNEIKEICENIYSIEFLNDKDGYKISIGLEKREN